MIVLGASRKSMVDDIRMPANSLIPACPMGWPCLSTSSVLTVLRNPMSTIFLNPDSSRGLESIPLSRFLQPCVIRSSSES